MSQAVASVAKLTRCDLCLQFLVLVFLKRNTPPLLLVVLNYMRLFRLLRLVRLLKVGYAWVLTKKLASAHSYQAAHLHLCCMYGCSV